MSIADDDMRDRLGMGPRTKAESSAAAPEDMVERVGRAIIHYIWNDGAGLVMSFDAGKCAEAAIAAMSKKPDNLDTSGEHAQGVNTYQTLIERLESRAKLAESDGDIHKDDFQAGLAAGFREAICEIRERKAPAISDSIIERLAIGLCQYRIDNMPPHVSKDFGWPPGTSPETKRQYMQQATLAAEIIKYATPTRGDDTDYSGFGKHCYFHPKTDSKAEGT